jgi:hypothetical protein
LKINVTFCLFEGPDAASQKEIPIADIDVRLNDIRGAFYQDFARFENVTIEECKWFFAVDGELAEGIREKSRLNPAGPKYFNDYDEFNRRRQFEWSSNDGRYLVKLRFVGGELEVARVFFSDTPGLPAVSWLTATPPRRQRKFDGSRKIPIIWKKDLGRSACFTLTADGDHLPVDPYCTEFCHFWTDVVVFEKIEENGTSKVIFGSNQALKPVFDSLKKGDKVTFMREPDNVYDPRAIMVINNEGVKIGYLYSVLAKILQDIESHAVAFIDESYEYSVKLLICVSTPAMDLDSLSEYSQRVYDAYPDPNW